MPAVNEREEVKGMRGEGESKGRRRRKHGGVRNRVILLEEEERDTGD